MKEPQLRIFTLHNDVFILPSSLYFILFCGQISLNSTKVLLANTLPSPNIRGVHHLPSILRAVSPKTTLSSHSVPRQYKYHSELQEQCQSDLYVVPNGLHFLTSASQEFIR